MARRAAGQHHGRVPRLLAFTPALALAVQFLLSYAGVRSRMIEAALLAQCVVMPMSLLLAGPSRLFAMTGAWYVVLALETTGAMLLHLRISWRDRRDDFWPMALALAATSAVLLHELAVQRGWLPLPSSPRLQLLMPLILLAFGTRLLLQRAGAADPVPDMRYVVDAKVREITAEIERAHAEQADARIEQVTQQERKRIAADLHDDLGAKLLTIVHTSESERISTLAREALEEMRLSVRGLTGKPVRLGDALADWRAETVMRLGRPTSRSTGRAGRGQRSGAAGARLRADHAHPARGSEQHHQAQRRIAREGALRDLRRAVRHQHQDNGKGIPMELDGKLDRGHGMTSMKQRAKQMQGQCWSSPARAMAP
ncbi:hypothetical protein FSC37_17735 [Piscinibacter aquaticus]|uniref:Signal transduction histidine kinase subgroup 3 dimerisation and phosphoacceptor domain-containing protein n=1 Tax=Piscinibacter aquaticus TaxID=392597 RepID=A0A5C6U1T1_9BURK|nr:hypothetical protein FSC37_17735 [Piscinibacter aquaticus]